MKIDKTKLSRRDFFKAGTIIVGGIAVSSTFIPFDGLLFAIERPKGKGKWYGIGIDINKCIGCGKCAKACKIENNVLDEPFYFRSWVEQYTIKMDGSILVESPNGGIDGFKQSVPDEEIFKSFFVPKMCNHCAKSPCVQVCPVGATFETPEGIVLVDETYCIGCRYCVQACPYGCRYIDPGKGTVDKCTLCIHRLDKGMQPACFEICPTEARIFGDLNDPKSKVNEFLKNHTCMVIKPHLNTDSKLFYNALSSEVR
ncbi:MAG: 4Fe-4S dicluster domain-containing protein [Lentimicrobium sp.]|nr:4Fe-4S dicluster domain-containing protein [Lentimicrobium sp.]